MGLQAPFSSETARAATPRRSELDLAGKGVRALIVDDDVDCAECLALLIERRGFEVRLAHDGDTAVALAASFRPHIALVDLVMPLLGGREVATHVRATPWGRHTKLVATSGMSSDAEKSAALAAGFDAYLTKPLDYEQLHGLLRAVVHDSTLCRWD